MEDKVKATEVQVKALEDLNVVGVAREAEIKKELETFKRTIWELKARIREKDEKIAKGEEYTTLLEIRFADATHKEMVLESRADIAIFKQKEAKVMAWEAKKRTEIVKAKAWAVEVKAASVGAQAIKE